MKPTPKRRAADHQPRWLLPVLALLILLGAMSVTITVATARDADVARRSDLQRTEQLVRQVERLTQERARDAKAHRERNELLHHELCEVLVDIARQVRLTPKPCPSPLPPHELEPDREEQP